MVISPHPDDESIGCGGTLRRHVLAGEAVEAVFLDLRREGRPRPGRSRDCRRAQGRGLRRRPHPGAVGRRGLAPARRRPAGHARARAAACSTRSAPSAPASSTCPTAARTTPTTRPPPASSARPCGRRRGHPRCGCTKSGRRCGGSTGSSTSRPPLDVKLAAVRPREPVRRDAVRRGVCAWPDTAARCTAAPKDGRPKGEYAEAFIEWRPAPLPHPGSNSDPAREVSGGVS